MSNYANDFYEISDALSKDDNLRERVLGLVRSDPIPGKVTEGGNRLDMFRSILEDLVNGNIDLEAAYWRTFEELPRHLSPHDGNNRVFPKGWAERLVRIQFSRFYNQAVLGILIEQGVEICFVPHSSNEDVSSPCTQQLAGTEQSVQILYDRLVGSYAKGNWSREMKIPDHPHCTHVVRPTDS